MFFTRISVCLFAVCVLVSTAIGADTEKWGRYEAAFTNPSCEGNPFYVEFSGEFESPSGRKLKQWGFYAGDGVWKLFFMPDEVGRWTYRTTCADPDLNDKTGEFQCTPSKLPGQLVADGTHWKLADQGAIYPVLWNVTIPDSLHWGFRGNPADSDKVQYGLRLAHDTVGATLIGFDAILNVPRGWSAEWPQDAVPYVIGKEGEEFYLPFWDQLNRKLDQVRDLGMGHYIMLYTDDELTPDNFGHTPKSEMEIRFFRYVTARLACYPIILWDSGIDVSEYRSEDWLNWYVAWFQENDPWKHPISSRAGGGSGAFMPQSATYLSVGGADIPKRSELMDCLKRGLPVAHTDHWRPFIHRGGWSHDKIRKALWRCGLSGGQIPYPDYNQGQPPASEAEIGAKNIGPCTRFFKLQLHSDFDALVPHDEKIVSGGGAILAASLGAEYVVYDEDGGELVLDLSEAQGNLSVQWYNPRTGDTQNAKSVQGGGKVSFQAPGQGEDWVLHLWKK